MKATSAERRFTAVLERERHGLGWTVARVPFTPREVWPAMVRLRIRGSVNGFAFRSALFPYPEEQGGGYFLLVNRAMQEGAGVSAACMAEFELEPDFEERPAELPDELDLLLDESPGLRAWYGDLSESMRREMGKWISAAKSDGARVRRAQQMAERMLSAMEAEVELPPAIAGRLTGKALAGWHEMTPTQRRSELLAVFSYQSPESREKRTLKLVDAAVKRASKKSSRRG